MGVLRALGEVQRPGMDTALLEVPLVEGDLLLLQLLEFDLLAPLLEGELMPLPAVQDRLLVLPPLLLEREFLLPAAVRRRPVDLEGVLLPEPAVGLDIDLHATLCHPHLLGGGVLDGLQPLLVLDVRLVATEPQGPGDLQSRRRPERPEHGDRLEQFPFSRGAVRDGEAAAHRPGRLLEFADERRRYVAVPALHEPARIEDLPGQVEDRGELEGVVVARQGELGRVGVHAHVHLVDGRVPLRRDLAARRPPGRQIRLVAALGSGEDQGVVDADQMLQRELEARQLAHGEHRVDQVGVPVRLLLPLGRAVEGGHVRVSSGTPGRFASGRLGRKGLAAGPAVSGPEGWSADGRPPGAGALRPRRAWSAADGSAAGARRSW